MGGNRGLVGLINISNQAGNKVDKNFGRAEMANVLNWKDVVELVEDRVHP